MEDLPVYTDDEEARTYEEVRALRVCECGRARVYLAYRVCGTRLISRCLGWVTDRCAPFW